MFSLFLLASVVLLRLLLLHLMFIITSTIISGIIIIQVEQVHDSPFARQGTGGPERSATIGGGGPIAWCVQNQPSARIVLDPSRCRFS